MNAHPFMYQNKPLTNEELKSAVRDHWAREPSGTRGVPPDERRAFFDQVEVERYEAEPHIPGFARWERGRGKRVLEVGVGAGTDFINWARHGAVLSGIDLTDRAVELAMERLGLEGLSAELRVSDVESLPFQDETFDIVYSYGVLHHTPDTELSISEVHRVLRPRGTALIMLYNLRSWTAWNLWAIHCLAKLRPWRTPEWAVYNFLESPGTRAFTQARTRRLFSSFATSRMRTAFLTGDLLTMRRSGQHSRLLQRALFAVYPRPLVRLLGPRFGCARLVEATK